MEQLAMGLFRNSDPHTSRLAAQIVEESGRRSSHKWRIFEFVKKHPAHTSKEIAKALDLCRYAVARRLPDLENDGLVCKCYEFKNGEWCLSIRKADGERDAVTWRAIHD